MNKKLIAAILAATTTLSAAPFALAENDENTKTSNMIKFNNDIVEITRKGQVDGKLIFQENQKKQSLYSTPMGDLLIEVLTKEIEVSDDDDDVNLKIKYQIHVDGNKVSDNEIDISAMHS